MRFEGMITAVGWHARGGVGPARVIGLEKNRSVGHQFFTLVLALLALSAMASLAFRARLSARRILPRFASVGVTLTYRVAIRNASGRRQAGLVLLEEFADPHPSLEEFVTAREPGEERRDWFDRKGGYPRWTWLLARTPRAQVKPTPLPPIAATGETEVSVELTPLRRGPVRFEGLTIARPDPLRLVQALMTIPLPQSLLVLPKRYPMRPIRLPGQRKYQPGGVALASSVGESDELISLRDD